MPAIVMKIVSAHVSSSHVQTSEAKPPPMLTSGASGPSEPPPTIPVSEMATIAGASLWSSVPFS